MKKYLLLFVVTVFCLGNCFGQAGEWTWISGDSVAGSTGVYGTQGIPSINNHPPGSYEYINWKDKQGNFWLYGGSYTSICDLWKYNPLSNEWTWMKAGSLTVYGTQGIADPGNSPGQRGFGCATWVDTTGNLWLFGGSNNSGSTNDLWKYEIATNEWTWINGSSTHDLRGIHGTKGISSPLVRPGARAECCSAWTDTLNNFWIYGGLGYDEAGAYGDLNDMMRYNLNSNEWTWMQGSPYANAQPNYGIKGISNSTNDPGGRWSYTKWKDPQGNFWMIGGNASGSRNDVWKYDLNINEWTWMAGTNYWNDFGNYSSHCIFDSINSPAVRYENGACATDNCNRFWMFSGLGSGGTLNDLWVFDPSSLFWNWMSGTNVTNQPGNHGVIGVPSTSNIPSSRCGAVAWWGNDNRFYTFGGIKYPTPWGYGDLWVFTPDSNCIQLCWSPPISDYFATNTLCPGTCTNFTNLSLNATNYHWNFFGASPDTSTDVNPSNICYATPGSYDVQLIATNANGSDTLLLSNYITVYPSPPPQSITQNGDTLLAIPGSASYQWYFNSNIISGATDYFYVAQASGDYNVVATDANGCEVEAAVFNVVAGIPSTVDRVQWTIFPNPVEDKFTMHNAQCMMRTANEISVYNVLGEKVYLPVDQLPIAIGMLTVDCRSLSPGLYYIEITAGEKTFRSKFIKSASR